MTPSWSKNGLLSAASFVFRNRRAEFATLYVCMYVILYISTLFSHYVTNEIYIQRSHLPFYYLMVSVFDDFFYSKVSRAIPFNPLETRDTIFRLYVLLHVWGLCNLFLFLHLKLIQLVPSYYNPGKPSDQLTPQFWFVFLGIMLRRTRFKICFSTRFNAILAGYISGFNAFLNHMSFLLYHIFNVLRLLFSF